MALMTWGPQYSVQVPDMDDQHKVLFDCINNLNDAMAARKGNEAMGRVLDTLIDYTRTHFDKEEALLKAHNYPELNEQQNQHRMFIDQIKKVKSQHEAGTLMLSLQTLNFLRDWLKNHIQVLDRHYGEWLTKRGVTF